MDLKRKVGVHKNLLVGKIGYADDKDTGSLVAMIIMMMRFIIIRRQNC